MSADVNFLDRVASPRFCERLFGHLPDVVFFRAMVGMPPAAYREHAKRHG